MKLSEQLKTARFIGIMRRIPQEKILLCAEAFVAGGGEFLEITFDPSDSETLRRTGDAVRAVKRSFPRLHVGCGTVLNISMTDAAADAGAEFIVSPAASEAVIKAAHRREISAIPGAYTPNEILNAYGSGADLVKLFPVLPGGERRPARPIYRKGRGAGSVVLPAAQKAARNRLFGCGRLFRCGMIQRRASASRRTRRASRRSPKGSASGRGMASTDTQPL